MLWLGFAEMRGPNPPRSNPGGPPKPMPKGARAGGPAGAGQKVSAKGPGPNQGGPEGDSIDEEEEEESGEVAAVVSDIMPWAMSILLHAGLVILAIVIIWTKLPNIEEERHQGRKTAECRKTQDLRQTENHDQAKAGHGAPSLAGSSHHI